MVGTGEAKMRLTGLLDRLAAGEQITVTRHGTRPLDAAHSNHAAAAAYGLKGETERAAAELAEARRLAGDGSFPSIAKIKANLHVFLSVRALAEGTYFAGLRKAGMPEE